MATVIGLRPRVEICEGSFSSRRCFALRMPYHGLGRPSIKTLWLVTGSIMVERMQPAQEFCALGPECSPEAPFKWLSISVFLSVCLLVCLGVSLSLALSFSFCLSAWLPLCLFEGDVRSRNRSTQKPRHIEMPSSRIPFFPWRLPGTTLVTISSMDSTDVKDGHSIGSCIAALLMLPLLKGSRIHFLPAAMPAYSKENIASS